MKFQRASDKDVQDILEIETTTKNLKTHYGFYSEKEVRDYINSEVVYLILKDNEITGLISYKIREDGSVYIGGLTIKPEFQRQGIGNEAMRKLLEELERYKKIDLVVHPENFSAIKLYKSLGFIEKSRMENHYGDGEPRLLLVLEKKDSY